MLSEPKIVEGELWFRVPGIRNLIPGLPRYSPDSPEWRELLGRNKKILPEAEIFLLDIGNWLEMALASIADLNTIQKSDLTTTESLVLLIGSLGAEFREQKDYLLQHQQTVADTGTDPKWLARPGNQARFVAHSMAGARWKLATSSSREMIRKSSPSSRKRAFQTLKISPREDWWIPEEKGE
jgi:hypothetical protein